MLEISDPTGLVLVLRTDTSGSSQSLSSILRLFSSKTQKWVRRFLEVTTYIHRGKDLAPVKEVDFAGGVICGQRKHKSFWL